MDTSWREWALCLLLELPTNIFYPDTHYPERTVLAKKVCAECEVRESCLEQALATFEKDGIWGGLTYEERKKYRLERYLKEQLPDSSRRNKQRAQLHLVDEHLSSQVYTSDSPTQSQLVSLTVAVTQTSSQPEQTVYAHFLSVLDLPLHSNQMHLYEPGLVASAMIRKLQNHIPGSSAEYQAACLNVIPVLQAISAGFAQSQQAQDQLSYQDQLQVAS